MSQPAERSELTLVVETSSGTFVRTIQPATPLARSNTQGQSAEEATESAAVKLGLPDFVFSAGLVSRGSGIRELGDRLVVVGDQGIVVQVKSRLEPGESELREINWVRKSIARATRQASGTVRTLRGNSQSLMNLRGRQRDIEGASVEWVGVVILDHEVPPAGFIPEQAEHESIPTVVLLRRDWEFLFDQLGATAAVLGYLFRVSTMQPIALGEEPVRYYELAQADTSAQPMDPSKLSLPSGARLVSTPLLPLAPAGHDDRRGHLLLRMIQEDIATIVLTGWDEGQRTAVLTELDSLPVAQRTELGLYLLGMLERVSMADSREVLWAFRRVVSTSPNAPHLVFGTCTRYDEATSWAFGQLVRLRHYEQCEASGVEELTSVGVLLTPRHDGMRSWDTTAVRVSGRLEIPDDELKKLHRLWGRQQDHDGSRVWIPENAGSAQSETPEEPLGPGPSERRDFLR
jgi:hypothetical protein